MLAGGAVYDSFAIRILKSYSSNDCSFKVVDTEKLWTEWEIADSRYFAFESKEQPRKIDRSLWCCGLALVRYTESWALGGKCSDY